MIEVNEWDDTYSTKVVVTNDTEDVRAVIVRDDYPHAPEFDYGNPVFQIEGDWRTEVRQICGHESDHVNAMQEALETLLDRFACRSEALEVFARYLRIFHDGEILVRGRGGNSYYDYVAIETKTWREEVGAVRSAPDMSEIEAWLEGDVFGVRLERKVVSETTITIRSIGGEVLRISTNVAEVWEPVEDTEVWGHYGEEWACEAACDALTSSQYDMQ